MNTETPHLDLSKVLQSFNEGQIMAYRLFWDAGMAYLAEHWLGIVIFLTIIYVVAIGRALFGFWGMLGSVLYHSLFFGILFVIGTIWGPEVFASNYIGIWLAILYFICYFMVGKILDYTGLRSRGYYF
ncbi:MAG: hypothetical protein KIH67_001915 [Candidatus Moranbacteria bacterium]|nr:hypothetical protein [Candidatus Moranbacteria bacterium]